MEEVCDHSAWNFENDWCEQCRVTAEKLANPDGADIVVQAGIASMTNDAFHRWSRQHGVVWET